MKTISRALLIILFTTAAAVAQTKATDNGWPRKFAAGNNNVAIYQPQIEEWTGNNFAARAALAITQGSSKQPLYGVLWFTARAEIDKVNRLVTLSDFKVRKINIPLAPDAAAAIEVGLQARAYWYGSPYTYGAGVYYGVYGWGAAAATNVYGQWGNVAYSGTRAAWANAYTANVGYGGVYTGVNTATGTRYAARGGQVTNVY